MCFGIFLYSHVSTKYATFVQIDWIGKPLKNGVQVVQFTCPFCQRRTTFRSHKSLPKCLTEQITELMRSWQILTSSTFSQTHEVVCFSKGTQTKPSRQKSELAGIGLAQAVLVSSKPFALKVDMESRNTVKRCAKELTELVDLVHQVNLMFPSPFFQVFALWYW